MDGLYKTNYHSLGHLLISEHCSPEGEEGNGPMGYDMVSARDPIFYRWHGHLEQLLQNFRDRHLPKYTLADFQLSDRLAIGDVRVKSTLDFSFIKPDDMYMVPHGSPDLQDRVRRGLVDILYSHTKTMNVTYDETTSINEVHMYHHPFVTKISISNPDKVEKKVILRIWFGLEFENG